MNFTAKQEIEINKLVNNIVKDNKRITNVFREEDKYKGTIDESLIITFIKGDSVHLQDENYDTFEELYHYYSRTNQIVGFVNIHHLNQDVLIVQEYASLNGQVNGSHKIFKKYLDKDGNFSYC